MAKSDGIRKAILAAEKVFVAAYNDRTLGSRYLFPYFGGSIGTCPAQAHLPHLPGGGVAEHPETGSHGTDQEIEAVAVVNR